MKQYYGFIHQMSATFRTTISISQGVADLAAKVGDAENRNFSNLCEVALQEYCSARGVDPKDAEIAAAVKRIGKDRALEVLSNTARRARAA